MTEQTTNRSLTLGAHHIGLTVPNLNETRSFFIETLGYDQVGEVPEYPAAFLSDGATMITLWQAEDPANGVPFERKNIIGLHHLALSVATESLDALHATLEASTECAVEFAPEPLGDMPVRHMMCNIPGGIRVEFIAPNA